MPDRPTTTVTTFDHRKLDRLLKAMEDELDSYDLATGDAQVRHYVSFGKGAVAALRWISGGPTGTQLFVLLEEAERILEAADRKKGA